MPVGQLINAGMGLLLQGGQDRRQVRQEGRLLEQQLGFDFEKMDYQQQLQKDLWEATNYPAQMKQLEKAGLSPGLFYGMSGAGGTTTGSPGGGVQGGKAAGHSGEIMGMSLLNEQRKLIEAQTEKTEAEAEKTAGVDTDEAKTRIESLSQGIKNQKAVERLNNVQGNIAEIEQEIKEGSYEDVISTMKYTARRTDRDWETIIQCVT